MKQFLLFVGILFTTISNGQDGTIDPSYNTGTGFDNTVFDSYLFSDNKLLAGGLFTTYNGTTVNGIVKLNIDGTIDSSFNTGTGLNTGGYIFGINVQSDGKILIGGDFTSYNGVTRSRVARLNTDGTLDTSFDAGSLIANNTVYKIRIQNDGKIVLTGTFSGTHNRIIRLNTNGSLDTTFNTGTGFNNTTNAILITSDNKILIGGSFFTYNGIATANGIVRLNSDGTIDNSFNAGTGANNQVANFTQQADGKIILNGNFTNYNGTTSRFVRINTDGSLDTTFNSGTGPSDSILCATQSSDGKLYISGLFTSYNGVSRQRVARLNMDGSLDTTFQPNAGITVNYARAIQIQSDNKIILVGAFTTYQGVTKNRIVRVGDISLSNNDYNFSSQLKNYPNPIDTDLFIDSSTNGTIEVFDINGRYILKQNLTIGTTKIQCTDLLAGIYIAKVTNELNETKIIKLIKK